MPEAGLHFDPAVCPVCAEGHATLLFRDVNRREGLAMEGAYVRCARCGMIYLSTVPRWDEFKGYYERIFAAERHGVGSGGAVGGTAAAEPSRLVRWSRALRRRPHAWPAGHGEECRTILDIGCDTGEKLVEFARRGWRVFGVDINPQAITVARHLLPEAEFHVGELAEVRFPPGTFDAIRLDNVLEHVPRPAILLRECRLLLKPGGVLYIYVPHGEGLSMRLLRRHSINAWIPFHLNLFTEPSLRRLVLDCGFRAVRVVHYSPADWLALSLVQWWSKPGWWSHQPRALLRILGAVLKPVAALATAVRLGEELVAVGEV